MAFLNRRVRNYWIYVPTPISGAKHPMALVTAQHVAQRNEQRAQLNALWAIHSPISSSHFYNYK